MRLAYPLSLLIVGVLTSVSWGIVGGEPRADDRRLDAVAALSRSEWIRPMGDKSPKAQHRHNWPGAATLIAPDKIVTARHLLPRGRLPKAGEYSVRFRRRADGGLGSVADGADSFEHIGVKSWVYAEGSDIAVGTLGKPVDHIQPINVDFSGEPLKEQEGLVAGWGSESPWQGDAGPRKQLMVGPNRFTRGEGDRSIRIVDYQTQSRERGVDPKTKAPRTARYITDTSAVPNVHDSGGAMLLEDEEGRLRLIGVITTYTGGVSLASLREDQTLGWPDAAEGGDEEEGSGSGDASTGQGGVGSNSPPPGRVGR